MDDITLKPFSLDTFLTGYMPVPREMLNMNLPSTAILLYAVLLDRATLSQKNHYADSGGWVYAIYPIERLADTLHISESSVKNHLRQLQDQGLILRQRKVKNGANQIYLRLPTELFDGEKSTCPTDKKVTPDSQKTVPPTARKLPPNNITEQHNKNDYYQHGEDESL